MRQRGTSQTAAKMQRQLYIAQGIPGPVPIGASQARRDAAIPFDRSMIADQRTLIELGILPRSSGDWPLRPLLDRTHSARAHEALKRVLATPLEGRTAVIERQRVFRALPALLKDVRWDECLKDCEIVEGFLSSNYVLVPSGKAARTVFASSTRRSSRMW